MKLAAAGHSVSSASTPMHTASGISMRQSSEKSRQVGALPPTLVAERVLTFLRRKHPRATAEAVAADTGIPRSTIAKWFERSSAPSGPALATLADVYRVEFLVALLPGSEWIAMAACAIERDTLERQLAANHAAAASLQSRLRSRR